MSKRDKRFSAKRRISLLYKDYLKEEIQICLDSPKAEWIS